MKAGEIIEKQGKTRSTEMQEKQQKQQEAETTKIPEQKGKQFQTKYPSD